MSKAQEPSNSLSADFPVIHPVIEIRSFYETQQSRCLATLTLGRKQI
jgi:hypothetical protein